MSDNDYSATDLFERINSIKQLENVDYDIERKVHM